MSREETQFRSGAEAVENGRRGGVASGESRRKRRELREVLYDLLGGKMPDDSGQTVAEAVCFGLIRKAIAGDPKSFEIIERLTSSVDNAREVEETFTRLGLS